MGAPATAAIFDTRAKMNSPSSRGRPATSGHIGTTVCQRAKEDSYGFTAICATNAFTWRSTSARCLAASTVIVSICGAGAAVVDCALALTLKRSKLGASKLPSAKRLRARKRFSIAAPAQSCDERAEQAEWAERADSAADEYSLGVWARNPLPARGCRSFRPCPRVGRNSRRPRRPRSDRDSERSADRAHKCARSASEQDSWC